MSDFKQFLAIRKAYAAVMPEWMESYEATGEMRQDPYFMDWQFTAIERNVWGDIRQLGLPFFPQLPALNYFLDFGNPFLKIGIECDGKAWHDVDLDRARDKRLSADGWMIFRLEGHECCRIIETDAYDEDETHYGKPDLDAYYGTTSEGLLRAIKHTYFSDDELGVERFYHDATLFEHMSTPNTRPVRRAVKESGGPQRMGDCMAEYMALLMRRMAGATA